MIRFASLGSGSAGNALLVEAGDTSLMLDCGFGLRETLVRMQAKGRRPEDLAGILVTHEHGDHIGGVFRLARKYGLPLWMTHGTWIGSRENREGLDLRIIDSHRFLQIGDLGVQPFPVPHDAREPVQYVFSAGGKSLGVLTDIGELTPHVCRMLERCEGLILECNHDAHLLARSNYPASLKRRIAGRQGHLANTVAAELLARRSLCNLQHLVLAHLSEQNNTPALALAAIDQYLHEVAGRVGVATQAAGFDWCELS